jgi:micrococcal nuclease
MGKHFGKTQLRLSVLLSVTLLGLYTLHNLHIDSSAKDSSGFPDSAVAEVVDVRDGDSLLVRIGQRTERVRLLGIDAPELGQMPWGNRAKRHLKSLLDNPKIRIETDVEKRDRYGRLLAYIWTSDGRFVNLEMVRDGYAVLYTIPLNVRYIERLRDAQNEAKERKRGIWGSEGLTESAQEYRKKHPR